MPRGLDGPLLLKLVHVVRVGDRDQKRDVEVLQNVGDVLDGFGHAGTCERQGCGKPLGSGWRRGVHCTANAWSGWSSMNSRITILSERNSGVTSWRIIVLVHMVKGAESPVQVRLQVPGCRPYILRGLLALPLTVNSATESSCPCGQSGTGLDPGCAGLGGDTSTPIVLGGEILGLHR